MAETPKSIGNYAILGELGRGGMGVVYEAEHTLTKRRTALKVLIEKRLDDDTHAQRFLREGKVAASLDDSGIVQVYEVGEDDGTLFMAMEFVDGMPLSQLLRHYGQLDPKRATKVIAQAARALAVAHDAGIVHRDIKPANILIPRKGGLKIADFGLARALFGATTITETGAVMGTPYYMSPEQCRGEDINFRSDIYSLGVVYYELLTGSRPFSEESITSLMYKILEGRYAPPSRLNSAVLESMESVVRQMMALNPSDRYTSMQEVSDDLRACLENRPTKAASRAAVEAVRIPDVLDESTLVLSRNRKQPEPRTTSRVTYLGISAAILVAVAGAIWAVAGGGSGPDEVQGAPSMLAAKYVTSDELKELPEEERRAAQIANAGLVVHDRPAQSNIRVEIGDVFHPVGTVAVYPSEWTVAGAAQKGKTKMEFPHRRELSNGITEIRIDLSVAGMRDQFKISQYWLLDEHAAYLFISPESTHPNAIVPFPLYNGKSWEANYMVGVGDGTRNIRHIASGVSAERPFDFASGDETVSYQALRVTNDYSSHTAWFASEFGLVRDEGWDSSIDSFPEVELTTPALFGGFEVPPTR